MSQFSMWKGLKILIITGGLFSLVACATIKQFYKPASGYYYQTTGNNRPLIVPPDLTTPKFKENALVDTMINDASKARIFIQPEGIEVKRSGQHRYLLINRDIQTLWNSTQDFLTESGFSIEKSQANLGLLETNYLKRDIRVPNQELNFIRTTLGRVFNASYVSPILDKYRIRIEPVGDKVEIYLSINSLEELNTSSSSTDSENTEWRLRPRDIEEEIAMLYRLMAYFSGTQTPVSIALNDIQDSHHIASELITQTDSVSLQVKLNKEEAWRYVGWALDRLSINIDDKDKKESSFYISTARDQDKGFWSKFLGDKAIQKSFQILVRQINHDTTEILVNILSSNEKDSLAFNKAFLERIAHQLSGLKDDNQAKIINPK